MTELPVAHTGRAHSVLGASASHRWMGCPGSVALEATVPSSGSSEHAQEGTTAHEMAELILTGYPRSGVDKANKAGYDAGEMSKHVRVYTDYVESLQGAKWYEMRVSLEALNPPVDMFGTVDTVVWNAGTGHLEIVDLKYGQGVVVEVQDNSQLLYYLLGVVLTLKVRPETMRITIVQPRAFHPDGAVRSVDVTWEELKAFRIRLMEAAAATQDPEAPLHVGDHCRWCDAKAVCPAQREHALEVARVEFDVEAREPAMPAVEGLEPDQLALVLERAKLVEDWLKSVRDYAHRLIESGQEVPGWKLVAGRRSRNWRDPEEAEAWLRQRFKVGEVFSKKLISPAQAEKLVADRPRLEVPDEMIVWQDGAPKLAPADSPKPALNSGAEFPTLPSGDTDDE